MRLSVDAGLDDRRRDDRVEQLEVGPAGDLGHHAAVRGVEVDLARHDGRHHVVAAHHERRRGLVARGLDAEHDGRGVDRAQRRDAQRDVERLVGRSSMPSSAPARHRPDRAAAELGLDGAEALGVGGLADVVGPHDDGVVASLVVALADPRRREAEALVQLQRGDVADPHLQGERRRGHGDGVAGQRQQQAGADAGALLQRVDGDVGDVRRVGREHQPAVADEASPDVGHQVAAGRAAIWSISLAKTAADHGRGYTCCSIFRMAAHVAAAHAADAHDEVVARATRAAPGGSSRARPPGRLPRRPS